MKKPITLALAVLTFASAAQYNNTYDVNANSDKLTPSFVITNKKAESITVSYASTQNADPQTDYFVLTKHDAFGNVLYNNRIDPFSGPTDGLTNVEALIQTDDEGVLVAGYHYDDAKHIEQPFLLKVDVNGLFQWVRLYYVNKKPIYNSQLNKISLCRVVDDEKEHYFIVGNADSDENPGQDVTFNVIKVDASGSMIFSKKYYDLGISLLAITRNYAGDIEYSTNDRIYMISGYREQATSLQNKLSRFLFFYGINKDGLPVSKLMTVTTKSIPLDEDMVYDPNTNVFATTFTHVKSSYVTGASSVMGFITVDAGLNIANPRYIWHSNGSEHNSRSISLCKNGDYVICSGILDNKLTLANNPSWTRVYPNGKPSAFLRYNLKDDVYFGHHAITYNPFTGEEEYVLVNEHKTDLRVIRTAADGKACGVEKFEPLSDEFVPSLGYYTYMGQDVGQPARYSVYEKLFDPRYRKCDGDGSSYRPTGIAEAGIAGTSLIYPTVMSAGNARLTVENSSAADIRLEVYSMSGQLVFSDAKVANGKTELSLTTHLSAGIYLVKIFNTDGNLTSISKILITE